MPRRTDTRERVLEALDRTGGNAPAVAEQLGVSATLVRRIKKESWQPQPPAPTPEQKVQAALPSNLDDLATLKTSTIQALQQRVSNGELTTDELVRLLGTVLSYDAKMQAIVRPAQALTQYNQYNLFPLVNQMEQSSTPDELRTIVGLPPPRPLPAKS